MASEGLHEPAEKLSAETIDYHRAMVSLMEELEAVDWYNQRADATDDESLKAVLEHNRDEEKEHAAMTLEWLRRGETEGQQRWGRPLMRLIDQYLQQWTQTCW